LNNRRRQDNENPLLKRDVAPGFSEASPPHTGPPPRKLFDKWGGKRYNPVSIHFKKRFGCKVYRVSVNAGFTCPNRDGTISAGGCIYCGERGAASIGAEEQLAIADQILAGIKVMKEKNRADKFIAYFQSFTNTYQTSAVLRRYYGEALSVENVVGLSVSTRPDCLSDEIIDLLVEYDSVTYLWLELGLQTVHDKTLRLIGRGHDFSNFLDGYHRIKERGLKVCLHVILGLPGESEKEMMETADMLAKLKPDGIKIHLLHALKDTVLAEMYLRKRWKPLEMKNYIKIVCNTLERLHPSTIVHRLTGDPLRGYLVTPDWAVKKWEVLNGIDNELKKRDSFQGIRCSEIQYYVNS